jgi:homoserine kinase type II
MAVFTKLTKSEIIQHLENYDLGELVDFKEILAGIDNSNFIIETTAGRFILTIFEGRISTADLPFFINLKMHLAARGICCPKPILNLQSQAISDLKGKKSAIVTFLSGKTLEPRPDGYYDNIMPNHCFEVGKVLARMHLAVADFDMTLTNNLGVAAFRNFFAKFANLADSFQSGLRQEISEALDFIEANWHHNFPLYPVHADLFPDNVFFDDNQHLSGVIDFYFAASDVLTYDFAVVVNAWCFDEKNQFDEIRFKSLKQGYDSIRQFSVDEKEFLKIALSAASLRFLLTRLHDFLFTPKDSLVKIKDPREYLAKLRYFLKNDSL